MKDFIQKYRFLSSTGGIIRVPLLLYFYGDFPRRTVLKETLSLLTIFFFPDARTILFDQGIPSYTKSGQKERRGTGSQIGCATDIPGLYAAGDALGSHMSGGIYTQICSSLAGSAVQGAVAGKAAAGRLQRNVRHQLCPPASAST